MESTEIKQPVWLWVVMWLGQVNQSALIQNSCATHSKILLWNRPRDLLPFYFLYFFHWYTLEICKSRFINIPNTKSRFTKLPQACEIFPNLVTLEGLAGHEKNFTKQTHFGINELSKKRIKLFSKSFSSLMSVSTERQSIQVRMNVRNFWQSLKIKH